MDANFQPPASTGRKVEMASAKAGYNANHRDSAELQSGSFGKSMAQRGEKSTVWSVPQLPKYPFASHAKMTCLLSLYVICQF